MTTPYVTTRHRCDFCRKTYASKSKATAHENQCWCNPATRHCRTCANWTPDPRYGVVFGSCAIGLAPQFPYISNRHPDDHDPDYQMIDGCEGWEGSDVQEV